MMQKLDSSKAMLAHISSLLFSFSSPGTMNSDNAALLLMESEREGKDERSSIRSVGIIA
jgi:hypothetical protein